MHIHSLALNISNLTSDQNIYLEVFWLIWKRIKFLKLLTLENGKPPNT